MPTFNGKSVDISGMVPVVEAPAPVPAPQRDTNIPNPYLRTTIPLPFQYQPDTLRQFPQQGVSNFRVGVINSSSAVNAAAQGITYNSLQTAVTEIVNNTIGATLPTALSQITIPGVSLTAGASATGTVLMNPVFILAIVSVSGVARVRLYSTATARTADISRSNIIQPVPGLANYIISDHYLTGTATVPLTFPCCPCPVGTNQDVTPSSTIYYTITNIGNATATIATTLYYLPMEATS